MAALMEVTDLKMHFPVRGGVLMRQTGVVRAVDGISLHIEAGETLGLVGESGCGKSTLGKAMVRLLKPTAGKIVFDGADLTQMSAREIRPLRREIQMIFQDPSESLDPRMSVRCLLEEPFLIHGMGTKAERRRWVNELLERVGLPQASAERYPFEFSGGQRQRIGIARALALKPKLIICDEPVSALDVSVQSQILNLLVELQQEFGLSYLFISHDLSVVKHISDRVAVMYLGKIVEKAPAKDLYIAPRHAYTKVLLSALPKPDPMQKREPIELKGDVPSPLQPPEGSAFGHRIKHPRYAETLGKSMPLVEIAPAHWVAADPCCLSEQDWLSAKAKVPAAQA